MSRAGAPAGLRLRHAGPSPPPGWAPRPHGGGPEFPAGGLGGPAPRASISFLMVRSVCSPPSGKAPSSRPRPSPWTVTPKEPAVASGRLAHASAPPATPSPGPGVQWGVPGCLGAAGALGPGTRPEVPRWQEDGRGTRKRHVTHGPVAVFYFLQTWSQLPGGGGSPDPGVPRVTLHSLPMRMPPSSGGSPEVPNPLTLTPSEPPSPHPEPPSPPLSPPHPTP